LEPTTVSVDEALRDAASFLAGSRKVIGIGSPRASLEANFALLTMVGPDNFYAGVSDKDFDLLRLELAVLQDGAVRTPSLSETMEADAVFVLGEDVTNTAPVLALNLRQMVSRKAARIMDRVKIHHWNVAPIRQLAEYQKAMLYIATPCGTRLDDVALKTFHAPPDELARLGFAVASMLDPSAPAVGDLSEEERALADEIAMALKAAARPLVVSGAGCRSRAVIEAAANVCRALSKGERRAEMFLTVPEVNSLGLAMLEAAGGVEAAAGAVRSGSADTLIILENDLFRRTQSRLVTDLLGSAKHLIVIDHLVHATTLKADIVLPAATFAESSGSLVNNEGRAQRFYRVFLPKGQVRESWRWIRDMMKALGRPEAEKWHILDEVVAAIAAAVPALGALPSVAPGAGFRLTGGKVPRQSHRYSGRTAIRAQIDVQEPKQPDDPDTPLAFSMEGDHSQPPSALIPRFWAPGWNSVQSLNKFQEEVGWQLRGGDPGIRLIEPHKQVKGDYFSDIPARRQKGDTQWLFVPLHHIFGSEELSVLSPGVAKLCPKLYVALHPEDASALGMAEGDTARATVGDSVLELCVKIVPSLPRKVAGLPVGLPGAPVLDLPASGLVSKGESDG
jgi:NADH-quinone oxidoreductase subunit G